MGRKVSLKYEKFDSCFGVCVDYRLRVGDVLSCSNVRGNMRSCVRICLIV